jgi:DtxR family transcriptional regulator, Mn-dependent transcriptional regulator
MVKTKGISTEIRPTPTIEDYLAVIYVMERDGEDVIAARLAESLEVAPPTVTMTLKRMERDGWIKINPDKGISLTKAGYAAASSVIRRHMLIEWMLARMLKVPWSQLHVEADQIEHSISIEVENQMRSNLENPQLCPHGNPLPGYEHIAAGWLPLTNITAGNNVIIRRIHETAEDNHELMQFLETHGVIPGIQAEVTEVLGFNQTISLKTGGNTISVGFPAAKYIFVDKLA